MYDKTFYPGFKLNLANAMIIFMSIWTTFSFFKLRLFGHHQILAKYQTIIAKLRMSKYQIHMVEAGRRGKIICSKI